MLCVWYRMNNLAKYQGDVYRVSPDIAIDGHKGELKDIYDFKFNKGRWRKGQRERYNQGLHGASVESPHVEANGEVSQKTCVCDGKASQFSVEGA